MYDELIKLLRNCTSDTVEDCAGCPYQGGYKGTYCMNGLVTDAADAIEELIIKLNHADEQIEKLVEAAEERCWIPVTERLPETGVDVLVKFPHNLAVASRDLGSWVVNSGDGWCTDVNLSDDEREPTHWMPLPEPPKGEE